MRAAFLCKHVRLSRVFYNKQYLLTYLLTAVSCPTALGALCGQLTFPLAWCREHSAVMAIELLQPLNLACGTLFQSSCVIPTSPTDCSDDSWRDTFFGKHEHGALWLLICGAAEKHLLTYLLHERRGAGRPLRTPRPTNSSGRIYWPAGRRPVITIHHPSRPQAGCGTAADAQQARTLSVLHSNWRIAVFITLWCNALLGGPRASCCCCWCYRRRKSPRVTLHARTVAAGASEYCYVLRNCRRTLSNRASFRRLPIDVNIFCID